MDAFFLALQQVMQPQVLLVLFCGTGAGIMVGAIPGLTATMAVALMVSFTFHLDAVSAIMVLLGVYFGGIYGGSISAILLHIPGTPSAVMTALDGFPMARKGEGGRAIGVATFSSFMGGLLGMLILILFAPVIAGFALRFSAPEYFALAVFALGIVASLAGASLIKGLLSALLGLLICMVGTDPMTGTGRFTFGSTQLYSGLQFIPVMIGLFGLSEIFGQLAKKGGTFTPQKLVQVIPRMGEMIALMPTVIRSMLIGVGIGALPGTGSSIASFVAYNSARNHAGQPELFGQGNPEGIAASETANNASCSGALMPMLTLGIPGDAITAILIGAFILHNMQPGPMLFSSQPEVIYSIYIGGLVANVFMAVTGFAAAGFFARLISFPNYLLLPVILYLCIVGSFSVNNNLFDAGVMLAFGLIGTFLIKFDVPLPPLVLGVVIGPILEDNLRTAITMSQGEWSYFLGRPIALFFLALALVSIGWQMARRRKLAGRRHNSGASRQC